MAVPKMRLLQLHSDCRLTGVAVATLHWLALTSLSLESAAVSKKGSCIAFTG